MGNFLEKYVDAGAIWEGDDKWTVIFEGKKYLIKKNDKQNDRQPDYKVYRERAYKLNTEE
jgi:hypothetical protein